MKLYEFEGKRILAKNGLAVPSGFEIKTGEDFIGPLKNREFPLVIKAQVLTGRRGKNQGIFFVNKETELRAAVDKLFSAPFLGQPVAAVRIEKKLDISQEFYLSFTYDTLQRRPVLIFSAQGGREIEEISATHPEAIQKILINPLRGLPDYEVRLALEKSGVDSADTERLIALIIKIYQIFLAEDLRLLEINPLVRTFSDELIAADAKIILDEDAAYRHPEWQDYPPRTLFGRPPNERELAAKKIDEGEFYYRGTASKYLEFPGDIAVMFSGGGASIVCLDALIAAGGSPANYTEYSGNPPREKVAALARVVLSKPGLKGLWISGGFANFTRIDETFAGIVDALEEIRPKYPIVIRRAGPYDKEGQRLMEEAAGRLGLDLTYFDRHTPMTATAKIMVEKAYGHTAI